MSNQDEDLLGPGISFLGCLVFLQEVTCERCRQRGLDPADVPCSNDVHLHDCPDGPAKGAGPC